eukprot:TCONS_00033980-protein
METSKKTEEEDQQLHPIIPTKKSVATSYQELIISSIGEIGRWQYFIIFTIMLPKFLICWSMVSVSFTLGKTEWWKVTTGIDPKTNVSTTIRLFKDCSPLGENDTIVYGNTNTITSEFGLICDKAAIPTLIKTMQMVGLVIGSAINGQLGDWIGRRKCIIGSFLLNISAIFIESFSTSWQMVVVLRFLVGLGMGGYQAITTVYALEFVGTSWRTIIGSFPYWGFGTISLGGLYYVAPYWRNMYLVTGLVGLPFLILMLFTTESVRWLLIHGKTDEAITSINKIAKFNKRRKPDVSQFEEAAKREESEMKLNAMKYNYATLFRMKSTRMKTVLFGFCWLTLGFSYYVFIFGVTLLSGHPALNMALTGLGNTLISVLVWGLNKKFGRRRATMVGYMATVTFSLLFVIFRLATVSMGSVMTGLAIASVWCFSITWPSIAIFTVEIFPTTVRSSAYGFVSIMARIGGVVAAQSDFIYAVAIYFPYLIVGVLCIICTIGVFQLPETINEDLQDILHSESDGVSTDESSASEQYEEDTKNNE